MVLLRRKRQVLLPTPGPDSRGVWVHVRDISKDGLKVE